MNLFFYFLLLFLPIQLGKHFWPDFSFVSGIRVDYLSPTLYVTDIIVLLLFVICLIQKISNRKIIGLLVGWKLIAFLLFLIFGILLSKNQGAGLYGLLKLLEFIFLGFYVASNFKKTNLQTVLLLFSIGVFFESFLAFLQYLNHSSVGGIFYWFGERAFNSQTPGIANASINGELILRPYGTFPHPNVLAGYLIIAMAILIFNFKFSMKSQFSIFNLKILLFVISLILGTAALFLTMSRIAILLWVIILILRFMLFDLGVKVIKFSMKSKEPNFKNLTNENSIKIKNFKLKIITIAFIIGTILFSPLFSRFTNISLIDESIVQRGVLIEDALLMLKSSPLFGVGLNNFLVELPSIHKQTSDVFYLQPVHNIYLLVLSQTGIAGFVFFIWFIGKTYQNLKSKKNYLIINPLSLIISLSAILALGLFDHYFLTLQQGQLLFAFILGLCWAKLSKR